MILKTAIAEGMFYLVNRWSNYFKVRFEPDNLSEQGESSRHHSKFN